MLINDLLDEDGFIRDEHLGTLCPGNGVGVLVLGDGRFPELGDVDDGRVRFLMGRRGPLRSPEHPGGVRNEPHRWDIPGGAANMRETLIQVAVREVREETCLVIDPSRIQSVFYIDHLLPGQHWVSQTFVATPVPNSPPPAIPHDEREKCVELHYFTYDEALTLPTDQLTVSMALNLPKMRELAYFMD